jgi:ribosome-associated protein
LNSTELAHQISDIIFTKKGFNVLALDLRKLVSFTDYFVICSADSDTQVKAIADQVDKVLSDQGIKCWHREGLKALSWVLLDYVDVVVHIFKKDAREFYNLEKLWGDAPSEKLSDPVEQNVVAAKR